MSYNSRNPTIAFRVSSYSKGKLEKEASKEKMDVANYVKSIIEKYLDGELTKNEKTIEQELLKARLEKIKVETKYLQLKNDYFANFNKPLSDSGTRILSRAYNHQKIVAPEDQHQSPYDEANKRFQCVDCPTIFPFGSMDGFLSQMLEYKNHIVAKHNRELNAIEKDVFSKITFQGVSKQK